jgi:hypothetical protein
MMISIPPQYAVSQVVLARAPMESDNATSWDSIFWARAILRWLSFLGSRERPPQAALSGPLSKAPGSAGGIVTLEQRQCTSPLRPLYFSSSVKPAFSVT